jgi:hypothetical protein
MKEGMRVHSLRIYKSERCSITNHPVQHKYLVSIVVVNDNILKLQNKNLYSTSSTEFHMRPSSGKSGNQTTQLRIRKKQWPMYVRFESSTLKVLNDKRILHKIHTL